MSHFYLASKRLKTEEENNLSCRKKNNLSLISIISRARTRTLEYKAQNRVMLSVKRRQRHRTNHRLSDLSRKRAHHWMPTSREMRLCSRNMVQSTPWSQVPPLDKQGFPMSLRSHVIMKKGPQRRKLQSRCQGRTTEWRVAEIFDWSNPMGSPTPHAPGYRSVWNFTCCVHPCHPWEPCSRKSLSVCGPGKRLTPQITWSRNFEAEGGWNVSFQPSRTYVPLRKVHCSFQCYPLIYLQITTPLEYGATGCHEERVTEAIEQARFSVVNGKYERRVTYLSLMEDPACSVYAFGWLFSLCPQHFLKCSLSSFREGEASFSFCAQLKHCSIFLSISISTDLKFSPCLPHCGGGNSARDCPWAGVVLTGMPPPLGGFKHYWHPVPALVCPLPNEFPLLSMSILIASKCQEADVGSCQKEESKTAVLQPCICGYQLSEEPAVPPEPCPAEAADSF